jgi:DNA-binding MarR family transcriptional regulator
MHVSGAAVLKDGDDIYRMWYSGHYQNETYRIFYATARDETNWIKQGLAIDLGGPGEKDENGTAYPCVMKDDGYYKIWYTGVKNGWDASVMNAVNSHTIAKRGSLSSTKISLPRDQTWKDLVIDKTEAGMESFLYVSILDGTTNKVIDGFEKLTGRIIDISAIDNATHPTIRLMATFIGDGSTTPILNEWKVTWEETIAPESKTPTTLNINNLWPGIGPAAAAGIILFSLAFAGSTEVGRYRLFPLISPLYTRLKRKEVLDQFTRGRIFEYIRGHPGDHYNSIKLELDLNNGVLAHHLRTLEREDYVKSMRDGIYKRFYPVDAKIPRINGFSLDSIQGRMMEVIANHPGLTQKEVSVALDASQQVVSYHVKLLMDSGQLRTEKHGKTFRYYPV